MEPRPTPNADHEKLELKDIPLTLFNCVSSEIAEFTTVEKASTTQCNLVIWLQTFDMDQIVMGRTPQPALSESPPITPTVDQNNFARPEEISVSPDLSLDCSPGLEVCAFNSMCTNLSRSFILFSA
ncbi:hypothetical protein POTOM_018167 [Populus tomentosa]|uniref:Uncharacterized protein n=1 Tax=Populus tomentosa TaxID=118781 RepID=A0A8X8D7C3_POPTO|nr:hypothetical protein POTOM_018167 [Populus tomentosa]